MIKKRSKMNKIIMWGLIATASVSLASVGFASWVINTVVPAKSNDMNITVGAVSDKSITATAVEVDIGGKTGLSFDNLADGTVGSKIQNGDGKAEKLSFAIKTTLTIDKVANFQGLLTSLSFTFNDALDAAVKDKYITMPFATITTEPSTTNKQVITFTADTSTTNQATVTYSPNNNVNAGITNGGTITFPTPVEGTNTKLEITTTFTCGWGSKFNNDNPGKLTFDATDDIDAGKITKETFQSYIDGLRTALTGKKLNVTVTPNGK